MVCAPHRYIIDSMATGGVGYSYRKTPQYDLPKAYQPAYQVQTYAPITREMLPLRYQRSYYTSMTALPEMTGIARPATFSQPEIKTNAEQQIAQQTEDTMKIEQPKPETMTTKKSTKQDLARKILQELDKLGRE